MPKNEEFSDRNLKSFTKEKGCCANFKMKDNKVVCSIENFENFDALERKIDKLLNKKLIDKKET
jgi:hypothetical protein